MSEYERIHVILQYSRYALVLDHTNCVSGQCVTSKAILHVQSGQIIRLRQSYQYGVNAQSTFIIAAESCAFIVGQV